MAGVARPIVFLSDYGVEDEFVGICHAAMVRISPQSHVIHLSHAIPPQDVLRGALVLARSMRYLPADAVVIAVVDPGVGTPRRPVAVETVRRSQLLVGPDNGLLSLAWSEQGGVASAVAIESPHVVLEPVSATFHGRDIFAPAAAHLAAGRAIHSLGPPVDPSTLAEVAPPAPEVERGQIGCEVLGVDRFGNVALSVREEQLRTAGLEGEGGSGAFEVRARGRSVTVPRAHTFGDVAEGAFAAIVDSGGWVALVLNRGSAAEALGLMPGDPVTLSRPAE